MSNGPTSQGGKSPSETSSVARRACLDCGTELAAMETTCHRCGKRFSNPEACMELSSAAVQSVRRRAMVCVALGALSFWCMGFLCVRLYLGGSEWPAFISYAFLLPIVITGLVFGHKARSKGSVAAGKAFIGLVLGYCALVSVPVAFIMDIHYRIKENAEHSSCQHNLKELGSVFRAFAADNHGMFPRLSSTPGCLMFEAKDVYPKYLKEPRNLVCPSQFTEAMGKLSPGLLVSDQSYFYLGYVMSNDADVETLCDVYRQRMAAGQPMDGDIAVPKGKGTKGGETLYHLREGLERFLVTDINDAGAANFAQSCMPILIEWPKRLPFERAGGNILFADGHSEYTNYPGRWPMTEKTVQALEKIHALQQERK